MRHSLILTIATLPALFLIACGESAPPTPARGPADATYTVRARVLTIPDPAKPTAEFVVVHEPIPDFVNPNGTKGMPSMAMPFPLKPGVTLDGIAAGDIVRITFDLWTKPGQRGYEATRVEELPADTVLELAPSPGPHAPAHTH